MMLLFLALGVWTVIPALLSVEDISASTALLIWFLGFALWLVTLLVV